MIAVIGAVSRYPTWGNGNPETQRVLQDEVKEAFSLTDEDWKLVWSIVDGIVGGTPLNVATSAPKADEGGPSTPPFIVSSLMESYGTRNIREFGGEFGEICKAFGQVFRTLVPEVEFATPTENGMAMNKLANRIGKENAERFLYACSRFDIALKEGILYGTGHTVEARVTVLDFIVKSSYLVNKLIQQRVNSGLLSLLKKNNFVRLS